MKKLTFRNLNRDIEGCYTLTGDMSGDTPIARCSFDAEEYVINAYLERKLYSKIIEYLLTEHNWHWGINDFALKATDYLKRDRELSKLKRLWRGIIAVQKNHFWEMHAIKHEADVEKGMSKVKQAALESMARFRDILIEFKDSKEQEWLESEVSLLQREERRKLTSKPDPRKIDEDLFWELIESSRKSCESIDEQLDCLALLLEQFNISSIRKFQKILCQKLVESYKWDLRALAYIAQSGCSDDAFEDFRAWLILQGRGMFELALSDIHKVMGKVPTGSGAQSEGLLSVAAIAYESRAGKSLPPLKGTGRKLLGDEWEEEELVNRYPEACKYFDYGA